MVDRSPPAPVTVKIANALLVLASLFGIVVTFYLSWELRRLPSGIPRVLAVANDPDRLGPLINVWFIYPEWQISYMLDLSIVRWIGVLGLLLIPTVYFLRRGFRLALVVPFGLLFTAAFMMIIDTDFGLSGVDPAQLSPLAATAWKRLVPPGYILHVIAQVGMLCALFLACVLLIQPSSRRFFAIRHPSLAPAPAPATSPMPAPEAVSPALSSDTSSVPEKSAAENPVVTQPDASKIPMTMTMSLGTPNHADHDN
jgi:hypothetical protein